MDRRTFIKVVSPSAVMLSAGCGGTGGDGNEPGGSPTAGPTGTQGTQGDQTDRQEPTGTKPPSPDTVVEIFDLTFEPAIAEIAAGETILFNNKNPYTDHTLKSGQFSDGATQWDFEVTIPAGESGWHTFDESGVYEYFCDTHGKGTECGVILVDEDSYDGSLPCQGEEEA